MLSTGNTEIEKQRAEEKSGEGTKGNQPDRKNDKREFETDSLYTPPTLATLIEDVSDKPPEVIPFGTVCLRNGIHLPVAVIGARYGIDPHPSILPDSPLDTIKFDLPPSQVDKLAIYCINNGTVFLAPKNWIVLRADIGADGGTGILLKSPNSRAEWMYLLNDGACQGCAIDNIAQWVPGWYTEHKRDLEIVTPPKDFRYPVKFVRLGEHSVGFSYSPDSSYMVHGVTYYRYEPALSFFSQAYVALPEQDRPLATTILNFFLNVTAPEWNPKLN